MFLRKLIILAGLAVIAGSSAAEAQYQRKQLQPDFFVPAGEINPQEKLPPFRQTGGSLPTAETVKKVSMPEIRDSEALTLSADNPVEQYDMEKHITNHKFDASPDYKQKYDAYVNDLKIIAETGKAPENKQLQQDLAKMNSNERFVVK